MSSEDNKAPEELRAELLAEAEERRADRHKFKCSQCGLFFDSNDKLTEHRKSEYEAYQKDIEFAREMSYIARGEMSPKDKEEMRQYLAKLDAPERKQNKLRFDIQNFGRSLDERIQSGELVAVPAPKSSASSLANQKILVPNKSILVYKKHREKMNVKTPSLRFGSDYKTRSTARAWLIFILALFVAFVVIANLVYWGLKLNGS